MVEMTTLPSRISWPRRRISAMVAGEAEIASIIAIRPPSMRLAISISPSRVSSSTVPISRLYMRTGGGGRGLGFLCRFLHGGSRGAGVRQQQRLGVGRLFVDGYAHVVEHGDDDF